MINPCLRNAFTARLTKSAIEDGYCSYDYTFLYAVCTLL